MSNDFIFPLVAFIGTNDGANKGFWRIQPRDDEGQWIEMGASVLFRFRTGAGNLVVGTALGIYVGPSGKPGKARVLMLPGNEAGLAPGVHELDSNNLTQIKAMIPEAGMGDLISRPRKDKFGRPVKTLEDSQLPTKEQLDATVTAPTADDERLAKGDLTDEERAAEQDGRDNSPIADLPAGFEAENPEEVKNLLRQSGVDPDQFAEGPTPEGLDEMEKRVQKFKETAGLLGKLRNVFGFLKKSKMKSPDLQSYSERKREVYKTSGGGIAVPAASTGVFYHVDEDGNRVQIMVTRDENDGMSINITTPEKNLPSLKVKRNPKTNKWGIFKGNDEDPVAEFGTSEEASDAMISLVNNQLGFDPENTFSFAKGRTALRKRNENPRTKTKESSIKLKPSEEYNSLLSQGGDSADVMAKDLFERGMAGENADDMWETIANAPIDLDEDFNEDELEITEDPTDGLDEATPDVPEVPELVQEEELKDFTEDKPKYDRDALISDADLDAMGDPEEYREDFGGQFAPSQEQTRALNAIVKGRLRTVIDALAGAGKTTTLIGAANAIGRTRPDDRVLILTFNKKNAEDAKRKSPKTNTDARTTHSLAYAALTKNQKKAMKPKGAGIAASDKDVAALLELDDTPFAGENFSPEDTAFFIGKAITKFCNSADDEITEEHFRAALWDMRGDDGSDYSEVEIPKKFLDAAKRYWDDVSSDDEVGYWDKTTRKIVGKKRIRVTQDHSLKMWSLSNPDLSKLEINGKPVSVVFFDEAQDTNPAVAKVIASNLDKVQIAYVGDPNQAIYTFRGAENALEDAKITTEAIADLTVTRRFGSGLTASGNAFLNLLGAARRVRGVGNGGEILTPEEMPDGPEKAHLVRTNIGGLDAIFSYMEQGKTVGALSVFYDELEKSIYHLKWLSEDFKTRSKEPQTPDGRPAFSEDFIGIRNFKDLYDKAKKDPKSRAARWYNLVTMQGDGDIKKFEDILEKLVVDTKDSAQASTDIDTSTGASGTLWATKSGKTLEYAIDEDGMVKMEGSASFEMVDRVPFKDTLKASGMRWNATEKVWQILIPDDEERQAFINGIADRIPNRVSTDTRVPDVVISTAHRAKGLEWDYVVIGDDFPEPKESLKTGETEWPSEEELRLAYVAVTRARKGLSTGSLAWADDFQGRDGLVRANGALGRIGDFGMGAWDYYDKQESESSNQSMSVEDAFEALDYEDYNSGDIDDDFGPLMSAPPEDIPFVKDWVQLRPGEFSKYHSGVRWNIRQNRDGSIVVRPRTNEPELGSTKYDSWEELEADFPNLVNRGNQVGREKLKEVLKPYDSDGNLAKLVDSGASADEVSDALSKTDAWSDAVEGGTAPLSTVAARLSKYDGQKDVVPAGKKRKTAKPPQVVKKTFTPSRTSEFYDEHPDRQDDGGEVGRTPYDAATLVKIKTDGKPKNVKNALLRAFPGSMVAPDGSVIVYRRTKTEKYGPAAGEDRTLEIRVMEGKDGTFTLITKITNPYTEESQEYYHYKDYHSLASLVGNRTKQSASIERLLSYYFDRDENEFPFPGTTPKDRADWAKMYGGVEGSVAYLRRGDYETILEDPSSDDTQLKLRTPIEHAILALNGRDRRFNKSTAAWWTQMRKEKASLFQALESGDTQAATAIFRSYINGVPDTNAAKDTVKRVMSSAIDALYPNPNDARAKKAFISKIADEIDQELDPTGSPVKPHLSRNGRVVEKGNYVRWTNNEGETVVGRVSDLLGADNPNGGKYFYSDFAYVTFNDRDEKNPVLLNTKNMEVVDGEPALSDYKSWIREDDLKLRRYEEAGFTFDPETGIFYDADGNPVDRLSGDEYGDEDGGDGEDGTDEDAGDETPEPEEEDTQTPEPETPTVEPKDIKDLAEGDKVFDDNDELVGTVKSKKPAKYKGNPGYVVEFEDGKKSFYPEGESVRSESDFTKQTTPSALKKRAARLGLSVTSGGSKPSTKKTIPVRKISKSSDEGAVVIDGSRGKFGVSPTPEAIEAKDEMLAIGSAAWDLAEPEIVKIANEGGLKGNSLDEILDNIAQMDEETSRLTSEVYTTRNALNAFVANETTSNSDDSDAIEAGYDFSEGADLRRFTAEHPEFTGFYVGRARSIALFHISRDKEKMSKFRELAAAAKDAESRRNQSVLDQKNAKQLADTAQRKGTVAALKKLGVKFDSVSVKEFNGDGIILVDDTGKPILEGSNLEAARALKEAFQYIPRNVILALSDHLRSQRGQLVLNRRPVRRGDFGAKGGSFRIRVSKKYDTGDLGAYTDTMLHELWHGMQRAIPNLRALEHAWSFGRIKSENGGKTTLPKVKKIGGRTSELGFESDLTEDYMLRQYDQTPGVFFNPNDAASEVSTVLMQDMFSTPGMASRAKKEGAEVTSGLTPQTRQVISSAYYDRETDSWFTDKTKSTKLEDVVSVKNRSASQGTDKDIKALGMGLLLVLSDWSATEGVGPGNAVDNDGK